MSDSDTLARKRLLRYLPLFLLAVLALIAGLWAGLVRIGWNIPIGLSALPMQHGPLMISGFLGTLIALERVAAVRRRWMFAAPILSGAGWVAALVLPELILGPLLIAAGSFFFTMIMAYIIRKEPRVYTVVMGLGAVSWLVGNLLWMTGTPIPILVWWWAAYLVLTIAGERLELSRVLRLSKMHFTAFAGAVAVFLLGVILYPFLPIPAAGLVGVGMISIALWLILFDLARRNLRHRLDLTRFISICVFSGSLWLAVSGILSLWLGPQAGGPRYDALLHTLFVGYVFAMIFGHAPMIFPALTQLPFRFHSGLYLPLGLLHLSLVLRVTGDLLGWQTGRMWGGLLNEVAILVFLVLYAAGVVVRRRQLARYKTT